MAQNIYGLYKLSEHNVRRLMKRTLSDTSGNTCPGASRNEILALIYLTHIADSSGLIKDFQTSSFSEKIKCSRRDTFLILKNLSKKGFITYESEHWTGYSDIQILNNDYSKTTRFDGKNRYLNTNRIFLKCNQHDFYDRFKNLSLYAMRMFLWIMFSHDKTFGYQISHDGMASHLQIKSRTLIHKYIKEIEPLMLEQGITETPNLKKRIRYGKLSIAAAETSMQPDSGIEVGDDSYFKRIWKMRLQDLSITLKGYRASGEELIQNLYYLFSEALKKKLNFDLIEQVITMMLRTHGILNERTLYHIEARLNELSTTN